MTVFPRTIFEPEYNIAKETISFPVTQSYTHSSGYLRYFEAILDQIKHLMKNQGAWSYRLQLALDRPVLLVVFENENDSTWVRLKYVEPDLTNL